MVKFAVFAVVLLGLACAVGVYQSHQATQALSDAPAHAMQTLQALGLSPQGAILCHATPGFFAGVIICDVVAGGKPVRLACDDTCYLATP
jgi:hypothetical protein